MRQQFFVNVNGVVMSTKMKWNRAEDQHELSVEVWPRFNEDFNVKESFEQMLKYTRSIGGTLLTHKDFGMTWTDPNEQIDKHCQQLIGNVTESEREKTV